MTRPMPSAARERYDRELSTGRNAPSAEAWPALEVAHVLSQPWAGPHVRVHRVMLGRAWRERDWGEVSGQLFRLVAAGPASLTGRIPVGNTGVASVPARQSMPIRDDLARLLADDPAGGEAASR